MVTKTKLLGSPYTKCLPETQANKCYQEKTEEHIRNRLFVINGTCSESDLLTLPEMIPMKTIKDTNVDVVCRCLMKTLDFKRNRYSVMICGNVPLAFNLLRTLLTSKLVV